MTFQLMCLNEYENKLESLIIFEFLVWFLGQYTKAHSYTLKHYRILWLFVLLKLS